MGVIVGGMGGGGAGPGALRSEPAMAGGPRALARLPSGLPGDVAAPQPEAPKKKGNPFIRFGLLALFIVAAEGLAGDPNVGRRHGLGRCPSR